MVRIAWGTDWHLDHASRETRREFLASVAAKEADALVIAGDVGTALCVEERLRDLAESFSGPVYVVLGNHDFYGSSVAVVRKRIHALAAHTSNLVYLWDEREPVVLSEKTTLVGVDGWGDARYGNWSGTQVALNDFRLIHDLSWNVARPLAVEKLRALGDESALRLRPRLEAAVRGYHTVLVVTHVPPFREAAWHEGAASDDDWAPYFACKAVGDVLLEAAGVHPERKFVVVCGHTHGGGECTPRPNLRVMTGPAVYGAPTFQPDIVHP